MKQDVPPRLRIRIPFAVPVVWISTLLFFIQLWNLYPEFFLRSSVIWVLVIFIVGRICLEIGGPLGDSIFGHVFSIPFLPGITAVYVLERMAGLFVSKSARENNAFLRILFKWC